jgi:hypothetical protein
MREWADDYSHQMRDRFSHLQEIDDPVERKREFLLALDREEVARDFAQALSEVGGLELQAAIVSNEGTLDPVGPLAAAIGPVWAVVAVVVAAIGLFVALETEFAVHQHNAFSGPELLNAGAEPGLDDEFSDWLGLTRPNLRIVADVLATAMAETAQALSDEGALTRGSEELQASLDRLSVEGRL